MTQALPENSEFAWDLGKRPAEDPFIPILGKGEFQDDWSILLLHRVRLSALTKLSNLDKTSIKNGVIEKPESLFMLPGKQKRGQA